MDEKDQQTLLRFTVSQDDGCYLPLRVECSCGDVFLSDVLSSIEEWMDHHLFKHLVKRAREEA